MFGVQKKSKEQESQLKDIADWMAYMQEKQKSKQNEHQSETEGILQRFRKEIWEEYVTHVEFEGAIHDIEKLLEKNKLLTEK